MLKPIKEYLNWVSERLNIIGNLTVENIALRHQLVGGVIIIADDFWSILTVKFEFLTEL